MSEKQYVGIDGEGYGKNPHHKYVYLAASTEDGKERWELDRPKGIATIEAFDFLLELPNNRIKNFAFAFGYDLTKILEDIDNEKLYRLMRPELRSRLPQDQAMGPLPIKWNGYRINWEGAKFSLRKGPKKFVLWDIFKFYQSKFVIALIDWKVPGYMSVRERAEFLAHMQYMKDNRDKLDQMDPKDVHDYCLSECRCMAELARKLTEAHDDAGLHLRRYDGAGSSASAILRQADIHKILKLDKHPKEMDHAIASAFFGGRFENSVIGPVEQKIYNYDISSAYPYQLCFLPCLQHGVWELSRMRKDLELNNVRSGIVRYELGPIRDLHWGPFPFRNKNGEISFPVESGGGWIYKDEYIMGEKLFPNVKFKEAWIYKCECDCKPFESIPKYYLLRIRIGKEGPGIVIKLACNSCYGKLAQSVGRAIYNSWLWAGLITSGTRTQLLELLALHRDWSLVLMMATDGLATLQQLEKIPPKDTNTWVTINEEGIDTKKPLGGWEETIIPKGMFLARPGIYFPLQPTKEELKKIKGRGVGKKTIFDNWRKICDNYEKNGIANKVTVDSISHFCGAKSCITRSGTSERSFYTRAQGRFNKPYFGQWISREIDISFNPMPKREGVYSDGKTLRIRRMPLDLKSAPYERVKSNEALALMQEEMFALEQPDGGY